MGIRVPASSGTIVPVYGKYAPARYYLDPFVSGSTTSTRSAGSLEVMGYWLPRGTLDRLAEEVTVVGVAPVTRRLVVYRDSAGLPGELLYEGTYDASSSTGWRELTPNLALPAPDLYWIGGVGQGAGTQPTLRVITAAQPWVGTTAAGGSGVVGYSQSGVTGSAPATFGAVTNSGASPRIAFRFSSVG